MSWPASLRQGALEGRPLGGGGRRALGWSSPAVPEGATWRRAVPAAVAALVVASPWLGIPRLTPSLLVTVCCYGIAASGLNLLFGYAGMLSLGTGIFLGVSGYTTAVVAQRAALPMLAAVLVGVGASAVAGVALGAVLVRLSGHYFGVATLALALAFGGLVTALTLTGGGTGLTTSPTMSLGFTTLQSATQWYVFTALVTAAMLGLLAWVVAGRRGRILRLVRSDELAASVLGVRVGLVKLLAFTAAAVFAGVAGSLLFVSQGLVDPQSVGTLVSVQMAMLVVIGGPGYRVAGVVGAFVVLWLQALLNSFGNYELLVYGAILLGVVFYLRPGLEGALVEGWHRLVRPRRGPRARGVAGSGPAGDGAGASAVGGTPLARPGAKAVAQTASGGRAGLVVEGATRRFGGVVAVDGVSLGAEPGRVTALIGSNGAGKSTLLNLVSGVEPLDGGAVRLGQVDLTHASPAERSRHGIVRTFQVPRLVEELTVVENMVLGSEAAERALLRRDPGAERSAMAGARATLGRLGLGALADRPASSLGTGERKYVEVARAVFTGAAVLLLDEPAVGLSLEEVDQLREWLASLRDGGSAVVVIDHNLDFIKELADHVYVMDGGRVVWEGEADDLDEHGRGGAVAAGEAVRP
ncbi:MAG: ATP-binding cassette domain-containing protein [Actinomycetota bacterium]|nr:ATP-binding cassette domain-containing protein [Actinomycetota bacterium]